VAKSTEVEVQIEGRTLKLTNLRLGSAAVDVLLERRGDGVALHKLRREGEIEIALTT